VWLATLICVNLQTSFLTPPFGWALFFLRGVAPPEVTTGDIYRGIIPFVAMQVLVFSAASFIVIGLLVFPLLPAAFRAITGLDFFACAFLGDGFFFDGIGCSFREPEVIWVRHFMS